MYFIEKFDRDTGDIFFKVFAEETDGSEFCIVKINVKPGNKLDLTDYRRVPDRAYLREDNNQIEIIGTLFGFDNPSRPVPPPIVHQEIDGKMVKCVIAGQYEFDEWSSRVDPEGHNSIVFNLLEKMIQN